MIYRSFLWAFKSILSKSTLVIGGLMVLIFASTGCQDSSPDVLAPTTSISSSTTGCSVTGFTVDCASGSTSPVGITFTANEPATIYYAQGASTSVSVSTGSSSTSSGGTIYISGNDGELFYINFIAVDGSGNSSEPKTITLNMPDTTAPTTSISVASADTSATCTESGTTYSCDGPVMVTLSASESGSSTYYYTILNGVTSVTTTYSGAFTINAHGTNLYFYSKDTAPTPNQETEQTYDFEIDGLNASINGGYYNYAPSFLINLETNRNSGTHLGDYQIRYLKRDGTDVSADSTADSVFVENTSNIFTPHGSSVKYYSTWGTQDLDSEYITADITADGTSIYQIKYNLIQDISGDGSETIYDGTPDEENSLVLYVDTDKPRLAVVPSSGGSLNSTVNVTTYLQDEGHDKVSLYASTNTYLSTVTPLQSASATICRSTAYLLANSVFWQYCSDSTNTSSTNHGDSITLTSDTLLGVSGQDAAGNKMLCQPFNGQFSCDPNPDYVNTPHVSELFTPGMLQTSVFHVNEEHLSAAHQNFGHSMVVGDFDGDSSDDIAIGAPAYSYTNTYYSEEASKGAVYIWFNGLRERAVRNFISSDTTTDVTSCDATLGCYVDVTTDGLSGGMLRVFLDPSADTSSETSNYYLARLSDYRANDATNDASTDTSSLTASQIAKVLNKAFLSSRDTTYQNYLYADASNDGYLAIGHGNRTIQGYYQYSSNFDSTSDFYFSGTVRAYDYAFFGENDDDEFGYSLAIAKVDASTDASSKSANRLIVGAPGYSSNNGAIYVIQVPASDSTTDDGQEKLSTTTTNRFRITGDAGAGRFGHAISVIDFSGDGTSDIFTSAPYLASGTKSNVGRVYAIPGAAFSYGTSDTVTNVKTGSDVTGDSVNSLFGYSLFAGRSANESLSSTDKFIYIGAPGVEDASTITGYVTAYSLATSGISSKIRRLTEYGDPAANNFGYSLAIVGSGFDTDSAKACPCLVVGAPGSDGKNGKVWIYGDSYKQSVSGSSQEKLGVSVMTSGTNLSNDNSSIFIASQGSYHKGTVYLLRPQNVISGTTPSLKPIGTVTGSVAGDNLGRSMTYLNLGSLRGLVTGMPGEYYSTSTYYKWGGDYNRMGGVRVYSNSRLGL